MSPTREAETGLRGRDIRRRRLDEEEAHVFSLGEYAAELRAERAYAEHGQNGVILIKTPDLRALLEVAAAGQGLAEHVVRGPASVHVLEGALELDTTRGAFRASAGELAVLPHDEPRSVRALEDSAFVLWLSPFESDEDVAERSARRS